VRGLPRPLVSGSAHLALAIHIRTDPRLDQHAAHEVNRLGRPILPRLGAGVDLFVDDQGMREVAGWVATNAPFDRQYLDGADLPIPVHFGSEHSRQIMEIRPTATGRLVPRG